MDNLTTTITPLVIDLTLAAVILLVSCLKAKAGLYHSVMSVVIIILAIAMGLVGSKLLTPYVKDYAWEKYYKPQAEKRFDDAMQAALEGEDSMSQIFKRNWNKMIVSFGVEELNVLQLSDDEIDYSDMELVVKLRVITLVKAELLAEKVCHLGLFGVITAAALLMLTLLKNLLEKVADFSVIGWLNHGGGFVLGFIECIVIMILIVRGAGLLGIKVFDQLSEGTILLNWLVGGDIQGSINALQNLTLEDIRNLNIEDFTTVDLKEVGNELKELVESIDMSESPEQLQEVMNQIDFDQVTEDVMNTVKGIDVEGLTDKAKEIVDGAGDAVKEKAVETVKDTVKSVTQ